MYIVVTYLRGGHIQGGRRGPQSGTLMLFEFPPMLMVDAIFVFITHHFH